LCPGAFGEDQPDTELAHVDGRSNTVADEIHPTLLVVLAAREELGSDLDHAVELTDIERVSLVEADLEIADSWIADPRFLGAVDRLRDPGTLTTGRRDVDDEFRRRLSPASLATSGANRETRCTTRDWNGRP
jgi:hypothetical protein